ncbi:sigma-70 family RNA polymerase sigma factor [Pseudonocardia sp. RS010]|uniref:sigma-70 family RNA polymerase sigma factor n=1 Tax=Pseudonocardia sp. RS010 TaxID=3385979 RepID=UPI0039A309AD
MAAREDDERVTAWALAAGRGDRAALASFIRATQRDVQRFVAHLSGPELAEDLAQETYLRAFTALPRFAGEAPARAWLLAIARRVAADDVRRARRRPRTDAVPEWEDLGGLPGLAQRPAEGEVLLRALVAALDPDRREAFVLTQMLGLGYAEAAQVCGCPIGTIRSRVARAREDLAAALEARPRRRREA